MTLPNGASRASLFYWGAIEGAVAAGGNTADVWAAIHDLEDNYPGAAPFIDFQEVNALRSQAVAIRNSGAALAASSGGALDAGMIAAPPWARSQAERNAAPIIQARFAHTTRNRETGELSTTFRSIFFRTGIPGSVDALMAVLDADAAQLANEYEEDHVGISDVTLLAV